MNLNLDKVPVNLEEALSLLKDALTPMEIFQIKGLDSAELHFTVGAYLRNEWGLWDANSKINNWFKATYGVYHADDVSGIILECLINDLNNKPRQDKILAQKIINHWKKNL